MAKRPFNLQEFEQSNTPLQYFWKARINMKAAHTLVLTKDTELSPFVVMFIGYALENLLKGVKAEQTNVVKSTPKHPHGKLTEILGHLDQQMFSWANITLSQHEVDLIDLIHSCIDFAKYPAATRAKEMESVVSAGTVPTLYGQQTLVFRRLENLSRPLDLCVKTIKEISKTPRSFDFNLQLVTMMELVAAMRLVIDQQ